MNFLRRLYICLVAASAAATLSAASPTPLAYGLPYSQLTEPGEWRLYSAFNNSPRRIMESADKVFFLVHPTPYDKDNWNKIHSEFSSGLFFIDKNKPSEGFKDMMNTAKLSGSSIWGVNYNPNGDYLAVVYPDGIIDFVSMKDFSVVTCDALAKDTYPGAQTVTNITFDRETNDAWISNATGFLQIDSSTGAVKAKGRWSAGVNSVGRTGDKVVLISENAIYEAPASSNISVNSNFKKVGFTTTEPQVLMPLGGGRYAYMEKDGANSAAKVMIASPDASGTTAVSAATGANSGNQLAAAVQTISGVESNGLITKDGYLFNGLSMAYLIPFDATSSVKTQTLPGSPRYVSTWDWEKFWTFEDSKWFNQRDKNWTSLLEAPVRPNAPLYCAPANMKYFPGYGLVLTNTGQNRKYSYSTGFSAALVNIYKDGVWKDHSYKYTGAPDAIAADPTLLANFNNAITAGGYGRYPVVDPQGLVQDPVFPEYAHIGSTWDGMAAFDLNTTTATPYLLSHSRAQNSSMGDASVPDAGWAGIVVMKAMGFDANGTLWASKGSWNDPSAPSNCKMKLYYWTKEVREKAYQVKGVNKDLGWQWIPVSSTTSALSPSMCDEGFILTHPKNANKFILYFDGSRNFALFDNNGTITDTSDDTVIPITGLSLDNDSESETDWVYGVWEDPTTGQVYLSTRKAFTEIDVHNITDGKIAGHKLELAKWGDAAIDPKLMNVYDVCFDEYGRMWIAVNGYGIYCLSSDRKTVLANFTPENSGLPSADVNAVCWNPETQSLFISTRKGIAEVRADLGTDLMSNSLPNLKIYPEAVTPEYGGTVAVHNVPTTSSLIVRSLKDKTTVASLPAADNGITYWNLLNSEGKKVPTGRYEIVDLTSAAASVQVNVVR